MISLICKNGQIFCTIKNKITVKKKDILILVAAFFGLLHCKPKES